MKKLFTRGVIPLFVLLIVACGGGDGDKTLPEVDGITAEVTDSVSGVVADGYLVGAKVFSDRNGNKKWDDGEPSATTVDGGKYELEGENLDKYPLVVEVSVTVIDEDTGKVVGKPYVLSAPIGKPEFISPITTLIQARIEKDGLTVKEAEDAIQTQLGTNADLFSDYIETGGTPSEDQKNLRKVAQVVANAFGEFQEQINAKARNSSEVDIDDDYGAIIAIVVKEVEAKLAQIVAAVETLGDSTVIPLDTIDTIVNGIDDDIKNIDIKDEVDHARAPQLAALSVLAEEGTYYLELVSYGDDSLDKKVNVFQYGNLTGSVASGLTETMYRHDADGVWFDVTTSNEEDIVLGPSGWVVDKINEITIREESDGSITLRSPKSGTSTRWSFSEMNIAGKPMGSVVDDETRAFLKNPEKALPEGSKRYRIRGDVPQDEYQLDYPINGITSFDDIIDADPRITIACGTDVDFSIIAGGVVNFYDSQMGTLREDKGTWANKTVSGQKIIEISIPESLMGIVDNDKNETQIFAVYDGEIWKGEHHKLGVEFDNEFNKTAIEAIKENIDFVKLNARNNGEKETTILGSWDITADDGNHDVLTFIDEERYIIIHEIAEPGEDQPAGSVEYGTYTWDTTTGEFAVTCIEENDGDGYGGLWDEVSRWTTAIIRNNTLTLHLSYEGENYDVDFTRVENPADSLMGAYVFEEDADSINVLTLLSDSRYVMAHNNNGEGQALSGEFGTYTYDGSTFTVSNAHVNTDGAGGLYDDGGIIYTVTTQSGNLLFSDGIDEHFTFTRIVNVQKETEADSGAATQLLTELKDLVEATTVNTQEIGGYLHEDFLHSDCTKTGFIEWCQSTDEEDQIDLSDFIRSLSEATVVEVIESSDFTSVIMDYGDCTYMELRNYGNGLQLYGNQQLWSADIQTEAFINAFTNVPVITSVWGLGVDGDVFETGDYILVTGKGLPEAGYKMIQHEFNNPEEESTSGEFTSVCFVDELKVPELTDSIIDKIGENEAYLFTRYNSIDEPQEAYEIMLRQRPYKSTESSNFPAITSPDRVTLEQLKAGDDFEVTWNLPAGNRSNDITLFIDYTDGTSDRVDIELEGDAESVTFQNIQINSALTVKMYGLFIYAEDASGRTVASGFHVNAATTP